MFGFLKKKIGDFVGAIVGREEKKAKEEAKTAPATAPTAPLPKEKIHSTQPETKTEVQTAHETPIAQEIRAAEEAEAELGPQKEEERVEKFVEKLEISKPEEKPKPSDYVETVEIRQVARVEAQETPKPFSGEKKRVEEKQIQKPSEDGFDYNQEEREVDDIAGEDSLKAAEKLATQRILDERKKEEVARHVFRERKEESFLADEKERDLKAKVGLFSKFKAIFTGGVEITEKETADLFSDFEMALLESDVSYDTAQALISDLRKRLIGKRVPAGKLQEEVRKEIAFSLVNILSRESLDFISMLRHAKEEGRMPVKVLMVGPNGMGKTTTVAKLAHLLKKEGFTSVISASDTFRAAAIEQAVHHGEKLGVKVVKHSYGADPAAVAFDAIAHAKSHSLDVVLIDTAGRQDTNLNLLSEMQKVVRVTQPDYKIFVAEAVAGISIVSQVKTFHEKLKLDGIILTKLDCDAKGGGSLSIAYECGLPILFVGVGQGYDDFRSFNSEWIVRNVMAE